MAESFWFVGKFGLLKLLCLPLEQVDFHESNNPVSPSPSSFQLLFPFPHFMKLGRFFAWFDLWLHFSFSNHIRAATAAPGLHTMRWSCSSGLSGEVAQTLRVPVSSQPGEYALDCWSGRARLACISVWTGGKTETLAIFVAPRLRAHLTPSQTL